MTKTLKVENVGFMANSDARRVINKYLTDGYGIDAMVYHPDTRDTWITFYNYQEGVSVPPIKCHWCSHPITGTASQAYFYEKDANTVRVTIACCSDFCRRMTLIDKNTQEMVDSGQIAFKKPSTTQSESGTTCAQCGGPVSEIQAKFGRHYAKPLCSGACYNAYHAASTRTSQEGEAREASGRTHPFHGRMTDCKENHDLPCRFPKCDCPVTRVIPPPSSGIAEKESY